MRLRQSVVTLSSKKALLRDSETNNSPFLLVFRFVFCVASRVAYPDMRPLMRLEYEPKSCAISDNYLFPSPLNKLAHRGLVCKFSALIMLSVVSNLLWERLSSRGKNAAPTYRLDSFHTNPRCLIEAKPNRPIGKGNHGGSRFVSYWMVRNGDEITSATMHHSFRPPLPDLKSQKHQNSLLFHQLLGFEIEQI
jgi:hypothetical protein